MGVVASPFSSSILLTNSISRQNSKVTAKKCSTATIQLSALSTFTCIHSLTPTFPQVKRSPLSSNFSPKASSVGSVEEYTVEPTTDVKFQTSLTLPGCSNSLSLLGSGYREKKIAIIGVKVYAAGFYMNESIVETLNAWKGRPAADIQRDSSLYDSIFQAPLEKSLQIVLVRDIDGKTFWDALDEAISPRIEVPKPADESALSTFRSTFEGRPLKKGTLIFLTWLDPTKMIVSISSDGPPSAVDATIDSTNVTSALFDVFFGNSQVSPTLKTSVSNGLAMLLK
ncbi:hypothetical protein C5167_031628 [Papaver somniferum]|uniref:Chalcone-flavonone isomerase family protein n=1 Tax=Papaver somniferum TaxID=3469 RepID=A0A4Y7K7S5_PAPSO|nr:fatty-acid-binding protein 3, chloroplastic-like [Papaver somniferum]RZC68372.1 hypothetical protein C5167_031628 [Papaver somniferum]